MKLYLAGGFSLGQSCGTDFGIKRHLISYFEINTREKQRRYRKFMEKEGREFFLDSGAFSMFHQGIKINLAEYIDYIHREGKFYSAIAALDVMFNAEKSMDNYLDMARMGCNVIPTYHFPEPWEYLDKYVKLADYIAIGGLARISKERPIINSVVNKALDRIPKATKIHLFGVTNVQILKKFGPRVYSCDSTTWLNGVRYASFYARSGKRFGYENMGIKGDWCKRLAYNVRRFQEIEQDINTSLEDQNHDNGERIATHRVTLSSR